MKREMKLCEHLEALKELEKELNMKFSLDVHKHA